MSQDNFTNFLAELWKRETSLPHNDFKLTNSDEWDDSGVLEAGTWSFYLDGYRERHFKTGDPKVLIEDGIVWDDRSYEQMGKDEDEYDARPEKHRKADEDKYDAFLREHRYKNSWRDLFHTHAETLNAPPPKFVIENFLQEKSLTMLGGPPACLKTYAALSIAKALITGEPLFDYFEVNEKAQRVLYLIPESSLSPFAERLKKLDMTRYVGKKFFFRTLNAQEQLLGITDPRILKAAEGADVFLDTAVRFMDGDENASHDQRVFAENLFALLKAGARTVTGLHHAPKAFGSQNQMTLENVLRGSGDIGAMLATCWGMSKIDADKAQVYFACVKDRDFKETPQPFILEARPHLDEKGKFKMLKTPGNAPDYASIKQSERGKKGGRPKVEYADAQVAKVFELHAAGESLRAIAEATGLSKNKVGQITCDAELKAKWDALMPWGDTVPKLSHNTVG
jgi:hypothetical protein